MYNDKTASLFIAQNFGFHESEAFKRCWHPAMRSDYFRMCYVWIEGGLYVDADDVLLGDEWKQIFRDGRLKVQPLCYDLSTNKMVPAKEIWRPDLAVEGKYFYVANDPIAAPAKHPVLKSALDRATQKLLDDTWHPEIQATTGPNNFSEALAAHAYALQIAGKPFDFELMENWDQIAETRWKLSYRNDSRNWRKVNTFKNF